MSKWRRIAASAVTVLGLSGVAVAWHLRPRRTGPALRTDHSFQFTARAPLRTTFPLFGAWGERTWAGDSWQPRFLYPDPPRDEEGEVFTVSHGHSGHEAVWVNTTFELESGRIQYVYVLPDVQAVLIDLTLEEAADGMTTLVRVRYRRTALSFEMNERVEKLGREDASSGPEWEQQVNAALDAGRKPGPDA
jgi:hypothetical protein